MPKSKNRKNHKAKVEQRNQRIRAAKNKLKREFQERLKAEIEKENKQNDLQEATVITDNNEVASTTEENLSKE